MNERPAALTSLRQVQGFLNYDDVFSIMGRPLFRERERSGGGGRADETLMRLRDETARLLTQLRADVNRAGRTSC
jgi:hypothetical protein